MYLTLCQLCIYQYITYFGTYIYIILNMFFDEQNLQYQYSSIYQSFLYCQWHIIYYFTFIIFVFYFILRYILKELISIFLFH